MPENPLPTGAMRGEKAPLLKPWKATGEPHRNGWTIFFSWVKHTILPAFIFMTVSIIFMVGFHQNPQILMVVAAFLALACLSDSAYIYRTRSKLTKECVAFAIYAFAIVVGGVVGTSIHMTCLLDYWPYYQKRHYTNVAPDEPAASHADASVIVFMEGARPDVSREIGYTRMSNRYCVAPITLEAGYSDDQAQTSDVQYWAIGKNCCGGHKGFTCDDAEQPKARSGLVMQELVGDNKLMMEGIMTSDEMRYYEKAVKMSLTKFDLTSPKERLYVRFVQDIDKARNGYWSFAWWSWMKLQLVGLFGFMVLGALTVLQGAGDAEDTDGYREHMIDARQSALMKLNHFC